MKRDSRNRGLVVGLWVAGGVLALVAVLAAILAGTSAPRRRAAPDHPLEATFQPFTRDDLRLRDGDRYYVDGQILLTAARGTEKPAIEALAEKVGAKVVGCLELSGDYQLQLEAGTSAEALAHAAAELARAPGVQSARLHDAYAVDFADMPDWEPSQARGQLADYAAVRDPWDEGGSEARENPAIPGYPTGADWWAEAVYLPQAWRIAEHCALAEVKVGVLDSMFDTGHGDLSFAKTYLNPKSAAGVSEKLYTHGTHVAGIIAARGLNGRGIRGASPNARLYGFALAGEKLDDGKAYSTDFMVKYALAAMLGEGVRLFNLSFGEPELSISAYYDDTVQGLDASGSRALSDLNARSREFQAFLERCEEIYPDFLLFVSAGNDSGERWTPSGDASGYSLKKADGTSEAIGVGGSGRYHVLGHIDPASRAAKHIVMVGSVDLTINVTGEWTESGCVWTGPQNYMKSTFSDAGADLYAPGGILTQVIHENGVESSETFKILSTVPESRGGTGMKMGTSMSAPLATGIAALVWGYRPDLTSEQLRLCLTNQVFATNALLGYTPADLPVVDAVAAMRVADEILGPRKAAEPAAAPEAEKAFFIGYAYTNPQKSDNAEDFVRDSHVTVLLFDENWVQQVSYTQDGGDSFAVTAPPGKYYARIISEDGEKEYIGEYELKIGEPAHDAVELQSRPYALYRFGMHQTTKSGEWYEIGAGTVSAQIAGLGGSIDYEYDAHISGYDPENPAGLRAEATGALSQYGLEVGYTMKYENGRGDYKYYPLGMAVEVASPGLEPELFNFDQITEAHLTDVEQIENYAFRVHLDGQQLATLTFTAVGAFNDLTGFELSDGAMTVTFNPDLSFKSIAFEVLTDVEALPYLSASAEYLLGYVFSDHPLREPRRIEAVNPENLENLITHLFG